MDIHERIARARHIAGLTQDQVADHFGIRRASVAQWEGKRSKPSVQKIIQLAALLNTTPDWLIDGRGEPPAKVAKSEPPSGEMLNAPSPTEIERFLRSIPYLSNENISAVLSVINGFRAVNTAQSEQGGRRDQSESANLPHAMKPSHQR